LQTKLALLIPTDSWEKLGFYHQTIAEQGWSSWGCAEKMEYHPPQNPPFNVYFYRDKRTKYKAQCFDLKRAGEVSLDSLPRRFRGNRKLYKNEFLIRNLEPIIDIPLNEILLWNSPQKRITWPLRSTTYIVDPLQGDFRGHVPSCAAVAPRIGASTGKQSTSPEFNRRRLNCRASSGKKSRHRLNLAGQARVATPNPSRHKVTTSPTTRK